MAAPRLKASLALLLSPIFSWLVLWWAGPVFLSRVYFFTWWKINYENPIAEDDVTFLEFRLIYSFTFLLSWQEGVTSTSSVLFLAHSPVIGCYRKQWFLTNISSAWWVWSPACPPPQECETTKVKTWSLSAWFLYLTPAIHDLDISQCLWSNFKQKLGSGGLFPAGISTRSWPMATRTSVNSWVCLLVSVRVTWCWLMGSVGLSQSTLWTGNLCKRKKQQQMWGPLGASLHSGVLFKCSSPGWTFSLVPSNNFCENDCFPTCIILLRKGASLIAIDLSPWFKQLISGLWGGRGMVWVGDNCQVDVLARVWAPTYTRHNIYTYSHVDTHIDMHTHM